MKRKILTLLIIVLFASCEKYSREKYPQFASKLENYKYVNSCYSVEFDNIYKIPIDMQDNINNYLKNRLGKTNFQKLNFKNGYVLSDKPIDIERTKKESEILTILGLNKTKSNCDSLINFPVYSVTYELKLPEIGIEKIGLNLMLDKNGKTVKDIDFPQAEFANKIISIDSVHSELIRRKIPYKKLKIDLWFDKRAESFIWSTSTLIQEGSIFGPSCFPEVNYHFKMNANNGEITEFEYGKTKDYFFGSNNQYVE